MTFATTQPDLKITFRKKTQYETTPKHDWIRLSKLPHDSVLNTFHTFFKRALAFIIF